MTPVCHAAAARRTRHTRRHTPRALPRRSAGWFADKPAPMARSVTRSRQRRHRRHLADGVCGTEHHTPSSSTPSLLLAVLLLAAAAVAALPAPAAAHAHHRSGKHRRMAAASSHVHPEVVGHGGPKGEAVRTFSCGAGQLQMTADEEEGTVVAQEYHTTAHEAVQTHMERVARGGADFADREFPHTHRLSRRLADQAYINATDGEGGEPAFVSVHVAHEMGATRGLRIVPVWEPVISGDIHVDDGGKERDGASGGSVYQCTREGVGIRMASVAGGGDYECEEDDIVTPELLELLQLRTQWAADFFEQAVQVKPVLDSITISTNLVNLYKLDVVDYPGADLVVIMTARPWPGLNGYALCLQYDQHGRCTVGQFNWVPGVLSTDTASSPDAIEAQRHTALHEMVHVLGGIKPDRVFIDDAGERRDFDDIWEVPEEFSEAYPKKVTGIKTERVLNFTREHFGCDSLTSVPLEDQPTGKVAHWEARVFGPELMSYGTGTGETLFGGVTFAYLEDTNQYIANYSMGGRIVPPFGDTGKPQEYIKSRIPPADFVPSHTRVPGDMTWGRGEGCEFVTGSAKDWSDQYFCNSHRDFACTHDFRMSAVCNIYRLYEFETDEFTCGDCGSGSGTDTNCRPRCDSPTNDQPGEDSGTYYLPTMFQYFATDAEATEARGKSADRRRTGGFSSAMDYVPVRLGYWNCQDTEATNGSSLLENQAGGTATSMVELLNGATDNMRLFGGQAYCPLCRCFVSSLMDFTRVAELDTTFPRFGLCYRSNCYTANYLQFAIESQLGRNTLWYKCPDGGGKLYIAGFAGAFHCPSPEHFCRFETITGIRYRETNPLWEWVFWSTVSGIPVLMMFLCLIPCIRRFCVHRAKKWCGVNHFNRRGVLDLDGEVDEDEELEAPDRRATLILVVTNGLVFCGSTTAFALTIAKVATSGISVAALFIIFLAFTTMVFSLMGVAAGIRKSRGTSCISVVYCFVVFFMIIMYLFGTLFALAYPDALGRVLEKRWPLIVETMPDGVLPEELDDGDGTKVISDNMGAIVGVLVAWLVFLGVEWGAIIRVVHVSVLSATMYTVVNWCFMAMGFGFWGFAAYATKIAGGLNDTVVPIIVLFSLMGLYLIASSIFALILSHIKTRRALNMAMVVSCVTTLATFIILALMFATAKQVDEMVHTVSEEQLLLLTDTLGLSQGTRDEISESLKNLMRTVGLMCVCIVCMVLCLMASTWWFRRKVMLFRTKSGRMLYHADGRKTTRYRLELAEAEAAKHEARVAPMETLAEGDEEAGDRKRVKFAGADAKVTPEQDDIGEGSVRVVRVHDADDKFTELGAVDDGLQSKGGLVAGRAQNKMILPPLGGTGAGAAAASAKGGDDEGDSDWSGDDDVGPLPKLDESGPRGAKAPEGSHPPAYEFPPGGVTASGTVLPSGWHQVWDDVHRHYYYYHESTGESSWDRPLHDPSTEFF